MRWTNEEVEILKKMWSNPEITLDDMTKVLTNRTVKGIIHKANNLKLPPVSERGRNKINLEYYKKLMEITEI